MVYVFFVRPLVRNAESKHNFCDFTRTLRTGIFIQSVGYQNCGNFIFCQ